MSIEIVYLQVVYLQVIIISNYLKLTSAITTITPCPTPLHILFINYQVYFYN